MTRVAAAVLLVLAACASTREAPPEITAADAERARALEASISANYRKKPPKGVAWFEVAQGSSRVLVVAGHATAHQRGRDLRPADVGTGSLARMLHDVAGTTTIRTTFQSPSDPNDSDDGEFKARLAELVESGRPAVVLDLHTSKSERHYDVDLGTRHGRSLLGRDALRDDLEAALRAEGLTDLSREFFAAEGEHTVAAFVSARGVPCIQVEVNGSWMASGRADADRMDRFRRLLRALAAFVRGVDR